MLNFLMWENFDLQPRELSTYTKVPRIGELSGAVQLFAGPTWVPRYCSVGVHNTVQSGSAYCSKRACILFKLGPTKTVHRWGPQGSYCSRWAHKIVLRWGPQGCSQVGSTFFFSFFLPMLTSTSFFF